MAESSSNISSDSTAITPRRAAMHDTSIPAETPKPNEEELALCTKPGSNIGQAIRDTGLCSSTSSSSLPQPPPFTNLGSRMSQAIRDASLGSSTSRSSLSSSSSSQSQQRTFVFTSDFRPELSSRTPVFQASTSKSLTHGALSAHAFDPPAVGYDFTDRINAPHYAQPFFDALAAPEEHSPGSGSDPSASERSTSPPSMLRRNTVPPSFSHFLTETLPLRLSPITDNPPSEYSDSHSILPTPPVTPEVNDLLSGTTPRRHAQMAHVVEHTPERRPPPAPSTHRSASPPLSIADDASTRPGFVRRSSFPLDPPPPVRGRGTTRARYAPPPRGTFMSSRLWLLRSDTNTGHHGEGGDDSSTGDANKESDVEEEILGISEMDLFGAELLTRATNWTTTLPWRKSTRAPNREASLARRLLRARVRQDEEWLAQAGGSAGDDGSSASASSSSAAGAGAGGDADPASAGVDLDP